MKTDELISKLSGELQAVKTPEKPLRFASKWSAVILGLISVLLLIVKPRADIFEALQRSGTLLEVFTFAGLLFTALLMVSWTSSPGRAGPVRYSQLLLSFLGLAGAIHFLGIFGLSHDLLMAGIDSTGARCTLVAAGFGVLAGALIAYKTRQGASTNPLMSGLLVGLVSLGAAGVGITLDCGSDNGMHIMLWHFLLPLALMTAAGFALGKKFLRW
jgi:hypothetical protein